MSTDEIMKVILADPFADVTFSGGDPMYQPEGFAELAKAIKSKTNKTIWCYTGFSFEQIMSDSRLQPLLLQLDVVVDGPYKKELRDPDLRFRGSSNQRIIDVRRSLEEKRSVEWSEE